MRPHTATGMCAFGCACIMYVHGRRHFKHKVSHFQLKISMYPTRYFQKYLDVCTCGGVYMCVCMGTHMCICVSKCTCARACMCRFHSTWFNLGTNHKTLQD